MNVFPVTTSTLAEKELGELVKDKYQLNGDFNCKLFRTGMNHTYLLTHNKEKYVLRVYTHNWRTKSEILEELRLLNLLKESNLNISFPIKDKKGEFIQEVNAPEGIRHVVLFSFAEGDKVRFMDEKTCASIGSLMAKIHNLTLNTAINRTDYNKQSLVELPYKYLKNIFSNELPEMEFVKEIENSFKNSDFENIPNGIVHMDIWYDNMAVTNDEKITIFDFDFCGNGWQILDVGYFCKQLFFIESDKNQYESKVQSFLNGYQKIRELSDKEIKLIPKAGTYVFVFYLGVQAQRFDWSNIFLTENYLKMFVGKIQSWIDYHKTNEITVANCL